MDYIKGITFGFMCKKGDYDKESTLHSLEKLKEETGADTIMLAVTALQDTPQSIHVDFTGDDMVTVDETKNLICYAKDVLGLKVILKPMVNVRNGTWRAFIDFFDMDVPCEPKWSEWFQSYNQYILTYGNLAEETGCMMLCIGCELVKAQRRDAEWRDLVKKVREVYSGLVTYNTDKYQEENVTWWDCVDVISSSGYYPIHDWDHQLKRIKKTVDKYNKPFFFAEAGCMSSTGSSLIPNDWNLRGNLNLEEQKNWYEAMFKSCEKHDFVKGFALWDWKADIERDEPINDGYSLYKKPSATVIRNYYGSK